MAALTIYGGGSIDLAGFTLAAAMVIRRRMRRRPDSAVLSRRELLNSILIRSAGFSNNAGVRSLRPCGLPADSNLIEGLKRDREHDDGGY